MKKIISLLLCILFTLSLFACEDSDYTYSENGKGKKANKVEEIIYNTIKFETNGGNTIQPQSIKELKEGPTPTKQGHVFEGWFLDETLTQAVVFPLSIDNDMTIYAKWLKVQDTCLYQGGSIDASIIQTKGISASITPNGFNMDRLEELGYYMSITVTYEVYYRKDYDVLFDIGYAGAPKFETYIKKSDKTVASRENQKATENNSEREISYKAKVSDIKNKNFTIEFWSDNVQNVIYFENIVVTYSCTK